MKEPRFLSSFVSWVEGEEPKKTKRPDSGKKTASVGKNAASKTAASAAHRGREVRPAGGRPTAAKTRTDGRSAASLRREKKAAFALYRTLAAVVCVLFIGTLLLTVSWLPPFGSDSNPEENEVYLRYVEDGMAEAGAVNTVADMILDYRAFDTLGESNVLFIAVCCVIILLKADRDSSGQLRIPELECGDEGETDDEVLRGAASVLLPAGVLYGVYVVLNGHLSAGGGFSGGAVIGGTLILFVNGCGGKRLEKYLTYPASRRVTFFALMSYTLLKSYSFYTGANGLESGIGLGTPGAILSGGLILPLNICVGLVVACTMYAFYSLFRKGGFGDGK